MHPPRSYGNPCAFYKVANLYGVNTIIRKNNTDAPTPPVHLTSLVRKQIVQFIHLIKYVRELVL